MENNNNNQILKHTNDMPWCSKSLDNQQEQTATNYLAKLRSKRKIGYNYKQKYT
jgi:hypothetical protein